MKSLFNQIDEGVRRLRSRFLYYSGRSPPILEEIEGSTELKDTMGVDKEGNSDPENDGRIEVVNGIAVAAKIASLYNNRLMTDVTLVVNGFEFPAHRLILCASSDVFAVMLMSPIWNESQETRFTLTESAGCIKVFEEFLKYLYTGQIILVLTNVRYFLELSDKYNVKDLIQLCLQYMTSHIPLAATKSQLVSWYQYSLSCGHKSLSQRCHNFIKWNLDLFVRAEDFALLEPDQMHDLLLNDDIVVADEHTLFTFTEYWISCQKPRFPQTTEGQAQLEELIEYTLLHIRFPMMSPRQLTDLLLSTPLSEKYKEFLMGQISISMVYHTGFVESLKSMVKGHPFQSKLFTPRLYCSDPWSICLTIDPFSQFSNYQSKTLVFSTPVSFCGQSLNKQLEWVVDFYPKGINFGKFLLIRWEREATACPEHIIPTVRLAVHCKHEGIEPLRVQISVIIFGLQDRVEHVRSICKRREIFSRLDKLININDILPYEELLPNVKRGVDNSSGQSCRPAFPDGKSTGNSTGVFGKSCFLVGESQDTIKVRIVITPIN